VSELPTGTVTFLFTDLESSTRLWEEQPEAMKAALARHDALLAEAVGSHGGHVIKGTGDGLHAVFATADSAVGAAVAAQQALAAEPWGPTGPLRVRMSVHTGVADQRGDDYFGAALNRAARLTSVAHPGQVLCTQATADLVRDSLPPPSGLTELGHHRLRDLSRPEVVFQVQHPDLPADFPPLRTLDAFPGNLPTERTPLIGRSRELARLAGLLAEHRLVTITGVGGVGKTRLAVQVAADVLDRFPDGAWFVALASIRDPDLVPSTVAGALGVPERPPRKLIDVLCDAIGSRQLLLVLDNCEHLLDPTARLVDVLLDVCPAVRVVATSREALGVEGEQSWPTPSLGLPASDAPEDVGDVAGADAVTLFVDRARAVWPDFELSARNAAAVAALCRRLDGIPLAIELAAARVSTLGPQDILERIDQRFLLLTGGSRTALERHQTLQAAVDWSYDLLDDRERRLFSRLSVFAGGFTLEAARAVAADEGATEVEVVDLLGGVVAKSMVIAERSGDSVRYRLLETLRQYARERLAGEGDAEATRDRHAHYYLELEETLIEPFFGGDQVAIAEQRIAESENRSAAFDWFVERGEARLALRLVAVLRGPTNWGTPGETLRRFEVALALAATLPASERVVPLAAAAWTAITAGQLPRAAELADESIACAKQAAVAPDAFAFVAHGLAAFWQGRQPEAIDAMDRGVELARGADDGSIQRRTQLGASLMQACFVLSQGGQTDRAIAMGEEALIVARRVGGPFLLAQACFQLGLAYRSTNVERAAQLLDESLALPLFGMSEPSRAWNHVAIGQLRSALGDHADALNEFGVSVETARQMGDRFVLPTALQGMARTCRQLDRLHDAARLLAAADGLAEQVGSTGGPADLAARSRAATRLRELLGPEAFDADWNRGHGLSFEEAIALALEVSRRADKAVAHEPPERAEVPAGDNVFRRDGDVWSIAYGGTQIQLRDAKGLRYLARLLAQPGREVHVNDLAAEATGGEAVPASGSGGEILDAAAKADYRRRLAELKAEVAEASEWHDTERVARAQAEIDALTDHLAGAYGLGGRARTMGDPVERVRKAVTNRIRDSLDRIAAEHESLGRHLANTVHTGTFCSYTPERPTHWQL
jgi:predicted ATPase/class 3 adenylate cyclase/tetratricopeptide (TPR) repeat protein